MRKHAAPLGGHPSPSLSGYITIEEWDEFGSKELLDGFPGCVGDTPKLRSQIRDIGSTKPKTSWIVCLLDGKVLTVNYSAADNAEVSDWLGH